MTSQKNEFVPPPWKYRLHHNDWIIEGLYTLKRGQFTGTPKRVTIAELKPDGRNREANAALIVSCVNALSGLNPEGVRPLIDAAKKSLAWILLGNHDEAPGWIEARDALMEALSNLEGGAS